MRKSSKFSLVFVVLMACGGSGDDASEPDAGSELATAFVVGTDYFTAGIASTASIPSLEVTQGVLAGVASTDPVLRYEAGRIFIVNRYGADNVTVIDASTMSLVAQISTGSGTNPSDVAVQGDTVYVATVGGAGIAILDLSRPDDGVVGNIDLSSIDPDDGVPNCGSVRLRDNFLFASCSVLDDEDPELAPRGKGKVAVIDTDTDTLVDVLELATANPYGHIELAPPSSPLGGDILVPTIPSWADLTQGCLERISTGVTPASGGCLLDNEDLGGYVSGCDYDATNNTLWVVVTESFDDVDYMAHGKLMSCDLSVERPTCESHSAVDERPFDLARCPTGHVVVADAGGGVRVYDSAGNELTTGLLDIGLPPVDDGVICF